MRHITGGVVVPPTVLTMLLAYVGSVKERATCEVFGIDPRILGFSVQDYVFDSVRDTFGAATLFLPAVLAAVPVHLGLLKVARKPRWRRWTVLPLLVAGLVLTVVGLLGELVATYLVPYLVTWLIVPLSLGLGVLLIGYSAALWRATSAAPRGPFGGSKVIDALTRVTFAAFLILTLFSSVATYARHDGFTAAKQIALRPASALGVVAFSPHPLFLQGPGVQETTLLGDQGSRYYRYDGLRLLVRANGRYILLPLGWRRGTPTVVLSDDPAVRLEFFTDN